MTDPVSVREGMGILDVVDVSKLGKVLMKVTRNKEDKVPHLDKVPGTNWRFMVYSNSIFHPRGFLFHDLDGKRITPRPTFQHMDHGGIGRSYLFDSSVKFVNVGSPVPGDGSLDDDSGGFAGGYRRRHAGFPSRSGGRCGSGKDCPLRFFVLKGRQLTI
ncbi:MAG: hypothetical protein ACLU7D_08545 [Collinsella sp.]